MKQRRKTIGGTKTIYPIWDRREPVNELSEQIEDFKMKQIQTQEVEVSHFIKLLKEKGIISKDTKIDFVIGHTYCDDRDNLGTPYVKKIKLTKEVDLKDSLL